MPGEHGDLRMVMDEVTESLLVGEAQFAVGGHNLLKQADPDWRWA